MSEELTLKIQNRELEILSAIDKLFKENNIEYYLAYGTVLGCVRHKGFIPWDDDVDLFIHGEDYPKVKEIFSKQNTDFLELHDFETKKGYPYVFPKIVDKRTKLKEEAYAHLPYEGGIYVDIFPVFPVSDNPIKRFFSEKLRYLRYARVKACYVDWSKESFLKKAIGKTIKFFSNPDKLQKKLYARYVDGKKKGANLIEPNVFQKKDCIQRALLTESVDGTFCGLSLPIPKAYEAYLTSTYGNYMELPPVEQRVSNHTFAYVHFHEEER